MQAKSRVNGTDPPRVIVVGAGPAGLMAAGQAAEAGASVLLLERMDQPGRKLRLTGKGRCNLTNISPLKDFVRHFSPDGRFLYSAFSRFFTADLLAFLDELGVATKVERGGRVFPISDDAQQIVEALSAWVRSHAVNIQPLCRVERLITSDGRVSGVQVAQKEVLGQGARILKRAYSGDRVILATGGASYPGTGSTGDGYQLASEVGHTIVPVRPALVPLLTAGDTARRLQGLTLRNVRVSLLVDDQVRAQRFGEMLFTHFGVSGPVILTLSRGAVDALRENSAVSIAIDLKPALDEEKLDARLRRDFDALGRREVRNILKGLLPRKLIPVCVQAVDIAAEKVGNQITSEERGRLRAWLKDFRLVVSGHRGFNQAIITAGGVQTAEVDPRTMQSRQLPGLFFAGEILDVDADTGGYNLQAAFSTGWLAGRSAAEWRAG
jgi:predicted Rossmann fold flavoprotein